MRHRRSSRLHRLIIRSRLWRGLIAAPSSDRDAGLAAWIRLARSAGDAHLVRVGPSDGLRHARQQSGRVAEAQPSPPVSILRLVRRQAAHRYRDQGEYGHLPDARLWSRLRQRADGLELAAFVARQAAAPPDAGALPRLLILPLLGGHMRTLRDQLCQHLGRERHRCGRQQQEAAQLCSRRHRQRPRRRGRWR